MVSELASLYLYSQPHLPVAVRELLLLSVPGLLFVHFTLQLLNVVHTGLQNRPLVLTCLTESQGWGGRGRGEGRGIDSMPFDTHTCTL